ncbi:NACHT and WD repeat domain-containing protein 2-like [Ambystoma mexicanum]|uniref:NACHT and WD repeat domain-containing protein 2-like n=1 Tax=Ambystoma mexicanum TaxID=8296 RepID=UPI0037E8E121
MASEDAAMRRARLAGDSSHIPSEDFRRCVRVFLCAEPRDSESERRILREGVYPKLREYCRKTHGIEFQVLDGYDGVDPQHVYGSHVRQCRMKLLKECLRSSVGPCFVALLGEQYGKPCLPAEIDAVEFEQILDTATQLGVCTKMLDAWYCRDENAVPPVYYMLEKEAELPHASKKGSNRAQEGNDSIWKAAAERELQALFDAVLPECVKKGTLNADQTNKYFTSALEEELRFALNNQPPEVLQRCICYVHKIPYESLKKKGRVTFKASSSNSHVVCMPEETSDHRKLCQLRDGLLPTLALHGGLQVFSTTTTCDMKVGYTEERKQAYLEGLCKQFYSDMLNFIECTVPKKPAHVDRVAEEAMQHMSLCNMYSDLYTHECNAMTLINEYIGQDGVHRSPLVVVGESCSGKTVLLASCAKKMHCWLKDTDAKLLVRFASPAGSKIPLRNLLTGLCQQIADIYQRRVQTHQKDVMELRECFVELLTAASKQSPLVLVLDILDHITKDDNARSLWWLPKSFPLYVKVIISTSLRESEILTHLKNLYEDRISLLDLKPQRKGCNENLKQSLLAIHRKITSGQQVYVNKSLERNTSPMWVLLLLKEVLHWRSHEDYNDETLGKSLHRGIERLFCMLEKKYGHILVSRASSYITLARSGICETELVDILSTDDAVLDHFVRSKHFNNSCRVPESIVAHLLLDLVGCMAQRLFMGSMVLCWTHTCYQLVVCKRYLNNANLVHELHTALGHYFSGRWACGRAKPYIMKHQLTNGDSKGDQPSTRPCKIYIDRQQPSQPWILSPQFSEQSPVLVNIRKAHELPYHLKKCDRLDELCNIMLTTFPFYKTMIERDQLESLISEVEDTAHITARKEISFMSDILWESGCLVNQNPAMLEMVFQATILPLATEYPGLLSLLKQVYQEGFKSSAIVALYSPLVAIAAKHVQAVEPSTIIRILEMPVQPSIIVVFANAALYSWNVVQPLTLVYRPSENMAAKDAELSRDGRHLVLLTGGNSLLILECMTWRLLCEINETRLPATALESPLFIKGFYVLDRHLYVWYTNASLVSVFDILSCNSVSELSCHQRVDCFSCTRNGNHVLLGLQNTVSVFDSTTFSHCTTIPLLFPGHGVKAIYLAESDTEVYIIDMVGNIAVWDILDPTQPQCLDEIYSSEESGEVISAELNPDFQWLLLCKRNQIQIFDTDGWGLDEFPAPKKSRFVCAILSADCELIIASIQDGPSLLVWRRDCGQCVLKLDIGDREVEKLIKCSQQAQLVAVMELGSLVVWNLDLIACAASTVIAKQSIQSVLLSAFIDHFYTTDGSEVVYKWKQSSYQVVAFLKHDNPIGSTQLTTTGEFLVTLEMHGDLYVWCTDTDENLSRIHGSHVSHVLLTPNGHFGVALSGNSISSVWKLTTGNVVCTFQACLQEALITPESTFVMGLDDGDLVAFSLWSSCASKTFQCNDRSKILAFQPLLNHPDITVVITISRNLYTWNVAEETICHQIELPSHFPGHASDCQISSDGSILIKMAEKSIHVLNSYSGKLGVLCTEGTVLRQHLSKDGRLMVLVHLCSEKTRDCDFHTNPILCVVQVSNGNTLGQFFLGKMPSCLAVSEDDLTIFLGYDDGTIGVYTVVETDEDKIKIQTHLSFRSKDAHASSVKVVLSKESPDIVWVDPHEAFHE